MIVIDYPAKRESLISIKHKFHRTTALFFFDNLTNKNQYNYITNVKTLPVGELKAHFSEVLEKVKSGESFGILYGKKKKPIAMIVPYKDSSEKKERTIGLLEGKVNIQFSDDFKISEEDFLKLS